MSAEHNKHLIHRFIEEVLHQGNMGVADELMAAEYHERTETYQTAPTRDQYKHLLAMTRASSPDYRLTVKELLAEEDRVGVHWTAHGTLRRGPRCGHTKGSPSEETIVTPWQVSGFTVFRVRENKLVQWGLEADFHHIIGSLSLSPLSRLTVDPLPGTTIVSDGSGASRIEYKLCNTLFSLPKNNAQVLTSATIINLYWGSYWKKGNAGYAKRYWVDDRAPFVFDDEKFWAPLREYSTSTQSITGGSWGYGWGANENLATGNLTRSQVESELGNEIDNFDKGAVTATFETLHFPSTPPDDALFVIWLPPGVTTDDLGTNFGYHWYFSHNKKNIPYAVIGFLESWQGYEDSMFITETHEVYEAVTDPFVTGWTDANGNEIGDVCGRAALGTAAVTIWDGGPGGTISVQKEWSKKKCDCVDIAAYGAELTAIPIVPGTGSGGNGPRCGVPGKPPCYTVRAPDLAR